MSGVPGRSGRIHRLALSERERLKILEHGYNDWRAGKVPDRTGMANSLQDIRVVPHALAYIDDPEGYRRDLTAYIVEREAEATRVRRERAHSIQQSMAAP